MMMSVYPNSSAVKSLSCSSSVSITWINFVCTWMKPAMSPVTERALCVFNSGLRRKEASALLASVQSLVLVLAQSTDGCAWFAQLVVLASQHKPPTSYDCAYLAHGITTGLCPTDAAENDKHL